MGKQLKHASSPLQNLRKEWSLFAALSILYLFGGFALLAITWQTQYALIWGVFCTATLIYQFAVLWSGLPHNHRPGEIDILPVLGWGNRLTLIRGMLIAGLVGFLLIPEPQGWLAWLPGIFYTLAIAADFFDGYLARITRHNTRLGEILDMSFDGLGVLAAILLAVFYGRLPGWYLLVAFARYAFVAGLWLRNRSGKVNFELPPSVRRRALAGFQMGFLAVMLWPLFSPPATHIAALFFGIPILMGFLMDWFYTTGLLTANDRPQSQTIQRILRWLPFVFRFSVVILGGVMILPKIMALSQLPAPQAMLTITELVVICLLAFGITIRTAAIGGLILLGFHQVFASLSFFQILMAGGYSAILFLGGGPFSLWTPEEYLVFHRAGEAAIIKGKQI